MIAAARRDARNSIITGDFIFFAAEET